MLNWITRWKKNSIGMNYNHSVERTDWEFFLDDIFSDVIGNWRNGLGIISDTKKANRDDIAGIPFAGLTYRISEKISPQVAPAMKLGRETFERIFELCRRKEPDFADCYYVKKLGLPNNSLVFPIVGPQKQRALIVFGGQHISRDLTLRLGKLNRLMKSNAQKSIAIPEAPSYGEFTASVPDAISLKDLTRTSMDRVKARLLYLDDQESLSNQERAEFQRLNAYVHHKLKRAFVPMTS